MTQSGVSGSTQGKKEQAINALQMLVAEGRLQPEVNYSHHALTNMISKHYKLNLSRTPILQALTVVDREGLFEQKATVGATLRVLSAQERRSHHEVRRQLEMTIAMQLARAIDDSVVRKKDLDNELEPILAKAAKAITKDNERAFIKSGRQFHCALAKLAGLSTLIHTVEALWAQSIAMYAEAMISEPTPTVIRDADMVEILREHRAIYIAVRSGNIAQTKAAIRNHFKQAEFRLQPAESSAVAA